MTKYQKYFEDMLTLHTHVFSKFRLTHDAYVLDPKKWQEKLNEEGEEVLAVIRKYENMLCSQSESSRYGKFSSKLSEKFWEIIRKNFPKIDFIGVH